MMKRAARVDWWRVAVAVFFLAAVLRSELFADVGSRAAWYAIQFGPILAAVVLLVWKRQPRRMGRVDWALIGSMGAIVLAAVLSITVSLAPMTTAVQTAILAVMFGFLAATYVWRWKTAAVIRGDAELVFVLIAVVLVAGLVALALGVPSATGWAGRVQGILSNPNYAGMLGCIAVPLAFYVYRAGLRWVSIVGALSAALSIILSGSRGALIAVVIAVAVIAATRIPARKLLVVAAALVVPAVTAAIFVGPTILARLFPRETGTDLTSGRGDIYSEMIERWQMSPLLGTGYRTTETFAAGGFAGHNIYLSTLTETGIVGALALLALIAVIVVIRVKGSRAEGLLVGAVVAIAVTEMTESSVFGWGGVMALVSWILILGYAAAGRVQSRSLEAEPALVKESVS